MCYVRIFKEEVVVAYLPSEVPIGGFVPDQLRLAGMCACVTCRRFRGADPRNVPGAMYHTPCDRRIKIGPPELAQKNGRRKILLRVVPNGRRPPA